MKFSPAFKRKFPYFSAAYAYAAGVASRKIPACIYVRQACERQLTDLDRSGFLYAFDLERGEKVCHFIEQLRHVKGEWAKKALKIHLEPWQVFGLTTLFGWVYAEDVHSADGTIIGRAGLRRFRTSYEEVPRKNAKSTKAAGIGLYMLDADGESGAEVYASATTRKQAKITFEIAQQMARRLPGLEVRAHNINRLATASKFEPLHAQGETLDGYNIYCALNDELHAWKKRSVYDVIETAMGAREQPLIYNITTAGVQLDGICFDVRTYLMGVLSGRTQDDSFFGLIYTIDDEDREHWMEPEVWRKANPNWNVSVYPMDMEAMSRKAREVPSELNAFLTKRLDVWVNASTAWMDMTAWMRGYDPQLKLEDFVGQSCYAGIDLASKIDVNSLALLFKREINGVDHFYCFMRHWLPEGAVHDDRFGLYDGWVRMGALRITPGNVIDLDQIETETVRLDKAHSITSLGVDPGHNSTQYGVHMASAGLEVIDVRPTVLNFSEPMKWLEAWVKDGRFHHNCPVLSWMISNVVARRDNKDNIYPKKETIVRKIDGVIALLIAINRMQNRPELPAYQVLFV